MTVALSIEEMRHAASAGVERRLRAIANGRAHRYAWDGVGEWDTDLQAAGAELAVAKASGRYWVDTAAPDAEGDVGERVQVRWTRRENGSLILHDTDPDDHAFVLVCGTMPKFTIPGWLFGVAGKIPSFHRTDTGRPAYFVPQAALREFRPERSRAAA